MHLVLSQFFVALTSLYFTDLNVPLWLPLSRSYDENNHCMGKDLPKHRSELRYSCGPVTLWGGGSKLWDHSSNHAPFFFYTHTCLSDITEGGFVKSLSCVGKLLKLLSEDKKRTHPSLQACSS